MNFSDIFKKSFLSMFAQSNISTSQIILTLCMTCIVALYIFAVYRLITRKTFYNKNFNISLAAISMITAIVILTIQIAIFISSYGRVCFSCDGIILSGKYKDEIKWNCVKCLYYCNLFIIGECNSLELIIDENGKFISPFKEEMLCIHCSKKNYGRIINLVPKEIIEANDFIFYPNMYLRKKDKYKIYKE